MIVYCSIYNNSGAKWLYMTYFWYRSTLEPWRDVSEELTDTEKMEEYHACQNILLIISNVLGGKKLESANLSPIDIEECGVFNWERSLLESET